MLLTFLLKWHCQSQARCYAIPLEYTLRGAVPPRRAVADLPKEQVEATFAQVWNLETFQSALNKHDLDEAWNLLSNAAEASLCSQSQGCRPRSEDWQCLTKECVAISGLLQGEG